jgi:histidinol-phosphate/aromatic aminotransferase/cobyric acid decarboxylase-like protein
MSDEVTCLASFCPLPFKVLVRYFASHALTASFLRISVGTREQNAGLLAAIARLCGRE